MLELTKCRSTMPTESKQVRSMSMLMPSAPHARVLRIPNMMTCSSVSDNGISTRQQAPTRGNRQETSGAGPLRFTSSATPRHRTHADKISVQIARCGIWQLTGGSFAADDRPDQSPHRLPATLPNAPLHILASVASDRRSHRSVCITVL